MKTPILLHIPEPCHENWDAMTPQDKGRHCQSCNKIVVDFSVMTDRQVLDYFKNAKGNTCGRFHDDQLQRPLIEPQIKPSKWGYLVASFLGFIMSGKIAAQSNVTKGEVLGKIMPQKNTAIVIGDSILPKAIIINGKVVDEKGKAIAGATIKIKGTTKGVSTDANGNFKIESTVENTILIVSAIGYENQYIATKNKMYVNIILIDKEETIKELPIQIPYGSVKITSFAGSQATSNKINGKVVDEKGNAIAGATVKIKGNNRGTSSKVDGSFIINQIENTDKIILIITGIGILNKEVIIEKDNFSKYQNIIVAKSNNIVIDNDLIYQTFFHTPLTKNILGKVCDENGNSIAGATIKILNYKYVTASDSYGKFKLDKLRKYDKIVLQISSIGFEPKEIEVTPKDFKSDLVIVLKESKNELKEVILQAPSRTIGKIGFVGGVTSISCKKIKPSIQDSTIKIIQKIFNNESIKIYPNPAPKNATIHITIKDAGEYSLQMFDTQSRLITIKNIVTKENEAITEFQLPASVIAGTYYLRFINEATKKQVTEKVIVQ